jgi:protein involved in polysaccharide export with SLBB domain
MKKILFIIIIISSSYTQNIKDFLSTESNKDNLGAPLIDQNIDISSLENLTYTPVEAPIDPDVYMLGPGDLLGINIISTTSVSIPVRVNPVGEIMLPSVGIININGLSISDAKEVIRKYVSKNALQNAVVDVTLLDVKMFKVQVLGAIINPGYVYVTSVDKVMDVILKSGGLQKFAHPDIVQIKRDGEVINISIKEYLSGKNIEQNILLKTGDIIYVPFSDYAVSKGLDSVEINSNQVVVYGYVNKTSGGNVFRYFPGYTVRDYIALAGGTKEPNSSFRAGKITRAKLYRADGTKVNNALHENVLPGDMIEVPPSLLYQLVGGDGVLRTLAAIISSAYLIYNYVEDQQNK